MESSSNTELALDHEIERLFALQDKPMNAGRKQILCRELLATNIPIGALLAGVRSLATEELTSIKFATICGAARRYIIRTEETGKRCPDCSDGTVSMKDTEGGWWALACRCQKGEARRTGLRIEQWNGEKTQISKGRMMTLVDS